MPNFRFTKFLLFSLVLLSQFLFIDTMALELGFGPFTNVFSPDSFWYKPVPKNVELNPDNANLVLELNRQLKHEWKGRYYNNPASLNYNAFTSPIYIVSKNVPNVKVTQWLCQKWQKHPDAILSKEWAEVPIPQYAKPSSGIGTLSDNEMSVYQPETDTLWEFWQARKVNGEWQACSGGRMQNVHKNEGIWQKYYGVSAAGLPFIAGQVTPEELKFGKINHVIGLSIVDADAYYKYSWPANRSDGYNPAKLPHRIPEGARLILDPKLDVDSLQISPIAKTIAKAAQKYGFVVWDKSGSLGIRATNSLTYTLQGRVDPYIQLLNGKRGYQVLDGFPWDKVQFLPFNYGKH